MKLPAQGLYAITSDAICRDAATLLKSVAAALRGGAAIIQYRDKINDADTCRLQAQQLLALCREAKVPLILNDGPASLALALGVDGMHLGLSDGDLAAARRLAPQLLMGATCGASLQQALSAARAGADYVAFGAFYPSLNKPNASRASVAELSRARAALSLPICAIGGITADNAPPLIAAGADFIAVIGGVFDAPDIEAAARRYVELFAKTAHQQKPTLHNY